MNGFPEHREGFDHSAWEHGVLDMPCEEVDAHKEWYACLTRECCGVRNDSPEEKGLCSKGNCTVLFCTCGEPTGLSWGPIGCGCEADRGNSPKNVSARRRRGHQRKMERLTYRHARNARKLNTTSVWGFWLMRRMVDRSVRMFNVVEGSWGRQDTDLLDDPVVQEEA